MRSLVPLLVCLSLTGCHRNIQNEDAVKQGLMDYLSSRQGLSISSMNVSITSMVFRQDQCDVMVTFTPKEGPAQPMAIPYTLERKNDRWVVKPRMAGGQNPHGGMSDNPHGGAGMPDGSGTPGGALPPGHPTVPPPDSPK